MAEAASVSGRGRPSIRASAQLTGLSARDGHIVLGIPILLLWWPLGERPGIGTLLNVAVIGTATNVGLAFLPGGRPASRAGGDEAPGRRDDRWAPGCTLRRTSGGPARLPDDRAPAEVWSPVMRPSRGPGPRSDAR